MLTRIFTKNLSKDQVKDTGLAVILIILFAYLLYPKQELIKISIVLLLINMIIPRFYYPFAIIWINISNLLGMIVPKIVLSIIFIFVVTPIGVLRRLFGIDSLKLKKFKADQKSVMVIRNHEYRKENIEKPF